MFEILFSDKMSLESKRIGTMNSHNWLLKLLLSKTFVNGDESHRLSGVALYPRHISLIHSSPDLCPGVELDV